MSEERAYGWDDKIDNPTEGGGDFVLLPEGVYPFRVTKFERGRHEGSEKLPACNKAIITVDIGDGTTGIATRTENLFLHTRTEGILCAFFTAIGQRKSGDPLAPKWNQVVGASGFCRLCHNEYRTKSGEKRKGQQVKTWLEPEEGRRKWEEQQRAPKPQTPAAPEQTELGNDDDIPF